MSKSTLSLTVKKFYRPLWPKTFTLNRTNQVYRIRFLLKMYLLFKIILFLRICQKRCSKNHFHMMSNIEFRTCYILNLLALSHTVL